MINKDGRGQFLDFVGGHSCYEGEHRAHGGSPSPPLEKTLYGDQALSSSLVLKMLNKEEIKDFEALTEKTQTFSSSKLVTFSSE